ncbi:hypothetical protein K443DRAFT_676002 [Laccaria amethystina LaAM-08-1]|jgi:predicted alpha/beta hydrolase family esterase|uniref:Serine aminopeptidase S33 domain-containing protein n=1 Tax=Laccaria amethystina LaAM-08-1 TaxID=1095629 RepID=A0A0C9XRB5_9AGAR|nr:hypothetical protein K443DRAFT_676002 [Laccaria amethystina LaAM-08-1]
MTHLSSMLAEKGFTCIQTDLGIGKGSFTDATNLMKAYESELRSAIRLSTIPFPPVIVARSSACLIAQTYISSHPAAGLVLISPPASNDELLGSKLSTRLKEFDFEPAFPIAIMGTKDEIRHLKQANRLCQKDYATVDVMQLSDLDSQEAFVKLDSWLDELGI